MYKKYPRGGRGLRDVRRRRRRIVVVDDNPSEFIIVMSGAIRTVNFHSPVGRGRRSGGTPNIRELYARISAAPKVSGRGYFKYALRLYITSNRRDTRNKYNTRYRWEREGEIARRRRQPSKIIFLVARENLSRKMDGRPKRSGMGCNIPTRSGKLLEFAREPLIR